MTSRNTVEIPAGEIPTRDQIALEDTWDSERNLPRRERLGRRRGRGCPR